MNNLSYIFRSVLLISLFSGVVIITEAQTGEPSNTIARFTITEATHNGADRSNWYLDRKQYFAFYRCNNNQSYCMANVSGINDDQSYGKLIPIESKTFPQTANGYKSDIFTFNWNYSNTYDNNTGWSKIILTKIYRPEGVVFFLQMNLTNGDKDIYWGWMEGTIDWNEYFRH